MVASVSRAEVAIFAMTIEYAKEGYVFEFSELRKNDTAVLIVLLRLIRIMPSLRSPVRDED